MPAAAISAASGLIGAGLQSAGAAQAGKAGQAAAQQTVSANQQSLNTIGNDVNPIIGYGNQSGGELAGLLGIGGNPAAAQNAFKNYLGSTNYQFQLGQGLQSQGYLNAPNLQSGATSKAFNNYAQGMAGNALQGYEGLLTGQEGLGLQGSNIYSNAATQFGNQNMEARLAGANASGLSSILQGGYGASAVNGIGNLLGSSYGQAGSAFNGLNNVLGGPGSATQQEAGFGQVAGVF